jgi:hypothetical protein
MSDFEMFEVFASLTPELQKIALAELSRIVASEQQPADLEGKAAV